MSGRANSGGADRTACVDGMNGEAGAEGARAADQHRVYTDTHAHLSLIARHPGEATLREALGAYADASCRQPAGKGPLIVDPGVDADDFPSRKIKYGHMDFVRLAAGIWPSAEALASPEAALAALAGYAADPMCRAIGECGPDYHHMNGTKEIQCRLFEAQMELAALSGKPLIVHSRDASEDTARIIEAGHPGVPVIIHCFGYGPREAECFLALGCHISFAGNITYRTALPLREACLLVPQDRLLVETDAPYMNPLPRRGKPSTSLDIERTYQFIAELRG